jgi:hypothetical protein
MASWADDDGTINPSSFIRPGQVKFYILHSLQVNGTTRQHILSCVLWYRRDDEADFYGTPTQVWRLKQFDEPGPAVFMPAQRIAHSFAASFVKRHGIDKLVVSPMPRLFN